MKHVLLLYSALLSSSIGLAQITFQDISWEEALKQANAQKKPVFVYAISTWCEPCQSMNDYTFSDLEVANYYNDKFINIQLDMEAYPGAELAEEYDVIIYPYMLFVDEKAHVIHRGCGAMDAQEFLTLGREAFSDLNYESREATFKAGDRSLTFISDYLELMDNVCLDAQAFAQKLLSDMEEDKLHEQLPFLLIEGYQWDIFSREFQYLLNNKSVFEDAIGMDRVNDKIFNTFLSQYEEIYESEELHVFALRALMKEMSRTAFVGSDTLQAMMNLHYHEIVEDWEAFGEDAINWVGMTGTKDTDELNDLAWKFYLFIEDSKRLEIASNWAKLAVDNDPSPSAIDTYASLQFKLGNRKKAIELEKQALELANSLNEETAHFEHQLAKFEKEKI